MEYPKIPPELDKRRKLSDDDKEYIRNRYKDGGVSTRQLAAEYGVSRRTIQFAIDPQKRLDNVERRRERIAKGWKPYTKEEWREYMRKHRARKREIHGEAFTKWELEYHRRYNKLRSKKHGTTNNLY